VGPMLFTQGVGNDNGFIGFEIFLHFRKGHILHTVTFHFNKNPFSCLTLIYYKAGSVKKQFSMHKKVEKNAFYETVTSYKSKS
jgi:hypothetical protein